MPTSTRSRPSGGRRTRSAKRIESPSDRPDRNGQTLETQNPDVVRAWAEARDATPAALRADDRSLRTLRFDFPGGDDLRGGRSRLEPVEWAEWLGTFRDRKLTFR